MNLKTGDVIQFGDNCWDDLRGKLGIVVREADGLFYIFCPEVPGMAGHGYWTIHPRDVERSLKLVSVNET